MIKVYWQDDDERVIRLDYYDPIESWDEYLDANKESFQMVRSKPYKVHMIHNAGDVDMPGGYPMRYVRQAMNLAPVNTGMVIMVISNRFARNMMKMLLRLTLNPDDYHFVDTLDSAIQLVDDRRASQRTR